jgi:hypothetical protein
MVVLATGPIVGPALANVDLLYFRAESSATAVTLVWETATELDNLGFNIYRSNNGNRSQAIRLNESLIASKVGGQPIGATYDFPDLTAQPDTIYTYWLQSVDVNGLTEDYGPIQSALGGGSVIEPPTPGGSEPGASPTPASSASPFSPTVTPFSTGSGNPPPPTVAPPVTSSAITAISQPGPPSSPAAPPVATAPPAIGSLPPGSGGAEPLPSAETVTDAAGTQEDGAAPLAVVETQEETSGEGSSAEAAGDRWVTPTGQALDGNAAPIGGNSDQTDVSGQGISSDSGTATRAWQRGAAALALLAGMLLVVGGGAAIWRSLHHRPKA